MIRQKIFPCEKSTVFQDKESGGSVHSGQVAHATPEWRLRRTRIFNNLTVTASFQYSDIDKAKEATTNFINTFNIQNIEELLEVIKMFYPYASNDNRQKSGTLFKDVPYGSPTIGRYFDFCRMPDEVWKTIVQDILNNK